MLAQFLLTLIVVAVIAILLWKAFGKSYVERYAPEQEDDIEVLKRRIQEIERKKQMIRTLEAEFDAQHKVEDLDAELQSLQTQLDTELDMLRKQQG